MKLSSRISSNPKRGFNKEEFDYKDNTTHQVKSQKPRLVFDIPHKGVEKSRTYKFSIFTKMQLAS